MPRAGNPKGLGRDLIGQLTVAAHRAERGPSATPAPAFDPGHVQQKYLLIQAWNWALVAVGATTMLRPAAMVSQARGVVRVAAHQQEAQLLL